MHFLELRVPPPIVGLVIAAGMWVVTLLPPLVVMPRIVRLLVAALLFATGVYSFTRNPMYLGMVLVLLAWAVFLASPWSLAGPALFALYITRFQIVPEERVLAGLFGESFSAYMNRVRRWI